MIKQAISNLYILMLVTLVFGGYGSAIYYWFDMKKPVEVALESSASSKPSASTKPSANSPSSVSLVSSAILKPSVEIKSLANRKPKTDIKVKALEKTFVKPSITGIKEPSTELINEASIGPINQSLTKPSADLITVEAVPESQSIERVEEPLMETESFFQNHLAVQAELRLQSDVTYDGRYLRIAYPMGDVPAHIGVCTDVVIRSFRGLGIDLQQRVHEDMKRNFRSYPNNWSLTKPDSNIDHRRVPNLMTYFKRAGASLKISRNPLDYDEGNIVAWDLGGGFTHIGIVSSYVSELTGNPLIIHNIGAGPEMNDMLFKHKIIGHYKYGNRIKPHQHLAETIFSLLEKNPNGFVFDSYE